MKESELYEPVKKFGLEQGCSEVYGEVMNCDVLGIHGEINYIVEMKTSLSFRLIDQALKRVRLGQYVYIAIPRRKQAIPRCVKEILTSYKIGLIQSWKNEQSKFPFLLNIIPLLIKEKRINGSADRSENTMKPK